MNNLRNLVVAFVTFVFALPGAVNSRGYFPIRN
jgi:hypothetical protein